MHMQSQSDPERPLASGSISERSLSGWKAEDQGPELLVSWRRRHREFLSNLRDILWPKAEPDLKLTSRPADFWPDVFVHRRVSFAPIRQSVLLHILAIVTIWCITENFLARQSLETRSPFRDAKITYYPVSEYLPPIDTGSTPAPREMKGAPEYARQPIISVPRQPDNIRQTIVTPPQLKIGHDVPLPNIVAWSTPAPEIPLDAVRGAKLTVPPDLASVVPPPVAIDSANKTPTLADITPTAIQPPPDASRAKLSDAKLPSIEAVAPPPDISRRDIKSPALPSAGAIPPAADIARRKLGDINIGQITPSVLPPRLPVAEQASVPVRMPAAASSKRGREAEISAPAPNAVGTAQGNAAGQMIALSLHPSLPDKLVEVPPGNRRGIFAATPEGKPGAPGVPEIKAAPLGNGTGVGTENAPNAAAVPAGIHVGRRSSDVPAAAIVGPPSPSPAPNVAAQKNVFLAAIQPRSVADLSRETVPVTRSDAPKLQEERKVFGDKRSYAMIINMPNLNSGGGASWIMRFAELHESADHSELSAPVADRKVDPAYPQDLIRQRIEGTVLLYAIIRADGSVTAVRVLRSVDQRLDENARIALTKWHFRPGTKRGKPIDVEAVVQIPFSNSRYFGYQ